MIIKSLLQNILIEPEALSRQEIDHILKQTNASHAESASIGGINNSPVINAEIRDTKEIDISPIVSDVLDIYSRLITNVINPSYNFEIDSSETPGLLKYEKGGHYLPHVDGMEQWTTPTGEVIWRKIHDRDLSTVIFLNNNFVGGEFVFPDFRISITPEPGMLICFPSNQYYSHGVCPVKTGVRYSLVNWMTIKGFQSLEENQKEIEEKYGVSST
jgi:predicted 2-oxoglutarate/Fe(II)-dependent dioxygenase YbiX